jgi:hypothetical protein
VQALPASVVNCSGAGDCLVAGAVYALMAGRGVADALAFGTVGGLPGLRALPLVCLSICLCWKRQEGGGVNCPSVRLPACLPGAGQG